MYPESSSQVCTVRRVALSQRCCKPTHGRDLGLTSKHAADNMQGRYIWKSLDTCQLDSTDTAMLFPDKTSYWTSPEEEDYTVVCDTQVLP